MTETLQDLVNRAVFLSAEMQAAFGRRIAEADWEVDFAADPPTLRFTGEQPLDVRAHMLGSESQQTATWHWGWDNINDFPAPVVDLSHAVRKYGAAHELTEFTTEEIDLSEELALRLTLAAKTITGRWAHYPVDAGGGSVVWLLVEHPELTLGQPAIRDLVRSLAQGLTETEVTDHRAALIAYAEQRGFPLAELEGTDLRILAADGSADVTFDEQNRITNCALHQPLEGEAAEQFAGHGSTPASTPAPAAEEPIPAPAPEPAPEPVKPESAPAPAEPVAEPTPEPEPAPEPAAPAPATEEPVPEPAPASTPEKKERPKKKGFFKKLFGG
ncbi:hypothetical protein M3B11_03210 [Brevibacterium sp. p3-SID960]|uniref:DUF6882 domain-containing protein n=1 Tax=Brevibacterium sp. p3-SID960 TaxID=2916063 RepID=UPI0021A5584D|nr:DUF6882 domain-containing protein [Brevibacterium sp. p3-SID960]MCT1689975.1 hypothetical protein [Brevibacterium sp. p3-SID960]